VLMQQVKIKEGVIPWGGKQGIVVTQILGPSAERKRGAGWAKVRIGNKLTEWIQCEQLKLIEPYPK